MLMMRRDESQLPKLKRIKMQTEAEEKEEDFNGDAAMQEDGNQLPGNISEAMKDAEEGNKNIEKAAKDPKAKKIKLKGWMARGESAAAGGGGNDDDDDDDGNDAVETEEADEAKEMQEQYDVRRSMMNTVRETFSQRPAMGEGNAGGGNDAVETDESDDEAKEMQEQYDVRRSTMNAIRETFSQHPAVGGGNAGGSNDAF